LWSTTINASGAGLARIELTARSASCGRLRVAMMTANLSRLESFSGIALQLGQAGGEPKAPLRPAPGVSWKPMPRRPELHAMLPGRPRVCIPKAATCESHPLDVARLLCKNRRNRLNVACARCHVGALAGSA